MATVAASFQSSLRDTEQAVRTALTEALPAFQGVVPQFGFILASCRHSLAKVLAAARSVLPDTEFIAAWGVNGFTQAAAVPDGLVGMMFASPDLMHVTSVGTRVSDDTLGAAKALVRDFAPSEERGKKQGLFKSATLMFVDGLSPARETLIDEVRKGCRPFQPIVGAAVTDDGSFQYCQVGTSRGGVMRDSAALFHVFSKQGFSIGVAHNHTPTTPPMMVTKASGVVLHTLDGRPALEVYREHAAERGVVLTEENLRPYLIQHPLGLYFFDSLTRLRSSFAALPDGSLICGGNIPEGTKVCIMGSSKDELIAAAGCRDCQGRARGARGGCHGLQLLWPQPDPEGPSGRGNPSRAQGLPVHAYGGLLELRRDRALQGHAGRLPQQHGGRRRRPRVKFLLSSAGAGAP